MIQAKLREVLEYLMWRRPVPASCTLNLVTTTRSEIDARLARADAVRVKLRSCSRELMTFGQGLLATIPKPDVDRSR